MAQADFELPLPGGKKAKVPRWALIAGAAGIAAAFLLRPKSGQQQGEFDQEGQVSEEEEGVGAGILALIEELMTQFQSGLEAPGLIFEPAPAPGGNGSNQVSASTASQFTVPGTSIPEPISVTGKTSAGSVVGPSQIEVIRQHRFFGGPEGLIVGLSFAPTVPSPTFLWAQAALRRQGFPPAQVVDTLPTYRSIPDSIRQSLFRNLLSQGSTATSTQLPAAPSPQLIAPAGSYTPTGFIPKPPLQSAPKPSSTVPAVKAI
jgi:hypothetical protein